MQPNQNQYSIDYLNEIAPPPKKPGLSNKVYFGIAGVGAILVLVVGLLLFSGGGSENNGQRLSTLSARMQTLQKTASTQQRHLKSGPLRNTNSNLSLHLTNAIRDIDEPLELAGVNPKSLDKNIKAAEEGTALKTKLEDARLSGTLDRTYAREMSYQLATVSALMKQIHAQTNSKSTKAFLETNDKNLQPIQKQLNDFTGTEL